MTWFCALSWSFAAFVMLSVLTVLMILTIVVTESRAKKRNHRRLRGKHWFRNIHDRYYRTHK